VALEVTLRSWPAAPPQSDLGCAGRSSGFALAAAVPSFLFGSAHVSHRSNDLGNTVMSPNASPAAPALSRGQHGRFPTGRWLLAIL